MATLRDLGPEPSESVPAGSRPVTAPGDRWVVLVGRTGPVSAIAPGTTLAEEDRLPGILVAAADMDVADALDSQAFELFADADALVLTEPDEDRPGQPRVAGVVSGPVLARLMLRGPVRSFTNPVLAGASGISVLVRSCWYKEGRKTCQTSVPFQSRPDAMPACPNDQNLSAHRFVW
jgi:hypothetical protein